MKAILSSRITRFITNFRYSLESKLEEAESCNFCLQVRMCLSFALIVTGLLKLHCGHRMKKVLNSGDVLVMLFLAILCLLLRENLIASLREVCPLSKGVPIFNEFSVLCNRRVDAQLREECRPTLFAIYCCMLLMGAVLMAPGCILAARKARACYRKVILGFNVNVDV